MPKILITAGGTGGHIFPAISLGKQLKEKNPSLEILYVGGNLKNNPYFDKEAFKYQTVSCATFKKKNPWSLFKTLAKIGLGVYQSRRAIKKFAPDLVIGFGSYYTLPILVASKTKRVPFILHEANSIPGKVNKLLARHAQITGIHFPLTAKYLKGSTREVGMPLRPGYLKDSTPKEQARVYFDLDPNKLTVLIFGGSQGALKLNQIVGQSLSNDLLGQPFQVIHFVGDINLVSLFKQNYEKAGIQACVKVFESRMDLAWQSADVAIVRSGAGTIAEQLEFEVPGILIPYPYATDNHQEKNAEFLVNANGAVLLREKDLTADLLKKKLIEVVNQIDLMKAAMSVYKKNNRQKDFCNLILDFLEKKRV
jgi:UDP-N-acetylglucosamine--N-acetylmuramyl-(pentapeptide) pyrophosphoryl-undecaprenol N-acetylglucosamine transferase